MFISLRISHGFELSSYKLDQLFFTRLFLTVIVSTLPPTPCAGSPCGPNAVCRDTNGKADCSCLPGYKGIPPNCRPECLKSTECPPYLSCVNEKCVDPCKGLCGINANCIVKNHNPICSCLPQYTGDPFTRCTAVPPPSPPSPPPITAPVTYEPIPEITTPTSPPLVAKTETTSGLVPITETPPPIVTTTAYDPCDLDPCGPNTICRNVHDRPICTCKSGYFGDPYVSCGPECFLNSDCGQRQTCVNQKCVNACPGRCHSTAHCDVVNYQPKCSCPSGYTGDPYSGCRIIPMIGTTSKFSISSLFTYTFSVILLKYIFFLFKFPS